MSNLSHNSLERRLTRVLVIAALAISVLAGIRLAAPPPALASCPPFTVHGTTFQVTSVHGISCGQANAVLRKWQRSGHVPHGWGCGLSAKACQKDGKSFTFRYY